MGRLSKAIQAETEAKFNKGFIPVDLNHVFVKKIFEECLATSDEDSSNVITSRLFFKEMGFDEDGTVIRFNYQKLKSHEREILFLLGQLRVVHEKHFYADVQDVCKRYDGVHWSKDNAILHLGHLSRALGVCGCDKWNDKTMFCSSSKIVPTISVSDPDFPAWWEEHHAEWEDPE